MVKLKKQQLKELSKNLRAEHSQLTAVQVNESNIIAFSWNIANGFKSGAIFWHNGKICTTEKY